jgi:hypothetical protein
MMEEDMAALLATCGEGPATPKVGKRELNTDSATKEAPATSKIGKRDWNKGDAVEAWRGQLG